MAVISLVTGGCRSGKSDYAQRLAEACAVRRLFLATAPVTDPEMAARIELHRAARRDRGWDTVEEPLELAQAFAAHADHEVVLVDCVTLWVNNLLYRAEQEQHEIDEMHIVERCAAMLDAAAARRGAIVFVTNEVGMDVVPENRLARRYRDLLGRANQQIAARADTVTLVMCGIPCHLKGTVRV